MEEYSAGLHSVAALVGAASSRPEGTSPEQFGPKALFQKVGGRLIAAPTGLTIQRSPDECVRCPLHTRPGLRPVHPLQAGEGEALRALAK